MADRMARENWSGGSGVEILLERSYSQVVVALVEVVDGDVSLLEVTSLCRAAAADDDA